MIKAVALDDEPLALEVIRAYCDQTPLIDLVQTFAEQDKAIRYLNKFDIDLLFLDIQMPKLNGLDLYKSLKQEAKVIFTTAYGQYAVEGFNVNASDYLLKPISFERFLVAIKKVKKEIDLESKSVVENTHLALRADFKLHNIPFDSILLIEALDDYLQVHLDSGKKIVTRSTMKGILEKLPDTKFKRAHRSFIVPLRKIESVYKDTAKIGDFRIPLSATYKHEILKNLNI